MKCHTFPLIYDYVGKADLCKDYWNPKNNIFEAIGGIRILLIELEMFREEMFRFSFIFIYFIYP